MIFPLPLLQSGLRKTSADDLIEHDGNYNPDQIENDLIPFQKL
jgi:hypothetical protein